MRFIYTDDYDTNTFDKLNLGVLKFLFGCYEIEDTKDEIIWLIQDKESYEEMRIYYEKYN